METHSGEIGESLAQASHLHYIKRHVEVIDALQSGKSDAAREIVLRLIRAEVAAIDDCNNKPSCKPAGVGALSPEATATLSKARELR
jgi:hypothetical protein